MILSGSCYFQCILETQTTTSEWNEITAEKKTGFFTWISAFLSTILRKNERFLRWCGSRKNNNNKKEKEGSEEAEMIKKIAEIEAQS